MFRISQCSEQRLDGAARFCHCLRSRCWFLPRRGRPQCPHHLSPRSRRQTPHHPRLRQKSTLLFSTRFDTFFVQLLQQQEMLEMLFCHFHNWT